MGTNEVSEEKRAALRLALVNVKAHMRITKVVCTRSIKGKYGDSYVGYSAAWDTKQDDAGGGGDLLSAQDGDVNLAVQQGLTFKEARLATLVLAMQADVAAHNNAMAGGNITPKDREEAIRSIRNNYTQLMLAEMDEPVVNGGKA